MKRTILMLSFLFCIISCKKDGTKSTPDLSLKTITMSDQLLDLAIGSSYNLKVTLTPINATSATLNWSSSDPDIVYIDDTGKLEAKKLGEVIITVKNINGSITASCKVTVTPIAVNEVVLDKTSLTLITGTKDKLNVSFIPTNTTNQNVIWISSDVLIVKVDNSGNVEALKTGEATITVKSEDGKAFTTCTVVVILPSLAGLDIDKKDVKALVGEEVLFNAVSTPPNAKPEEMIWSSSDQTVATISTTGLAKALKPGKTIIKVTNKLGLLSATSELTVSPVLVKSINITGSINLVKGEKTKIAYTISPVNATDKNVTFSSEKVAIATIDASGNITGVSEGETSITVSSKDGNASSKISVKVSPVKVVSITLDKTSISMLNGSSETITADLLPVNAGDKKIIWKSSNPSVATIDQSGIVKSISIGKAVITATTSDGGLSATCLVEVSTIDKLIRIAAKPNSLVASTSAGNSAELSVGIYNPTASPITIKFIRIYVNNVLSKSYYVDDADLSSNSYLYKLGPYVLSNGIIDMSNFMNGWTVKFEYENNGKSYENTVPVKKNVFGQVNFNDFFDGSSSQNKSKKSPKINLRKSSTIKLM